MLIFIKSTVPYTAEGGGGDCGTHPAGCVSSCRLSTRDAACVCVCAYVYDASIVSCTKEQHCSSGRSCVLVRETVSGLPYTFFFFFLVARVQYTFPLHSQNLHSVPFSCRSDSNQLNCCTSAGAGPLRCESADDL